MLDSNQSFDELEALKRSNLFLVPTRRRRHLVSLSPSLPRSPAARAARDRARARARSSAVAPPIGSSSTATPSRRSSMRSTSETWIGPRGSSLRSRSRPTAAVAPRRSSSGSAGSTPTRWRCNPTIAVLGSAGARAARRRRTRPSAGSSWPSDHGADDPGGRGTGRGHAGVLLPRRSRDDAVGRRIGGRVPARDERLAEPGAARLRRRPHAARRQRACQRALRRRDHARETRRLQRDAGARDRRAHAALGGGARPRRLRQAGGRADPAAGERTARLRRRRRRWRLPRLPVRSFATATGTTPGRCSTTL